MICILIRGDCIKSQFLLLSSKNEKSKGKVDMSLFNTPYNVILTTGTNQRRKCLKHKLPFFPFS